MITANHTAPHGRQQHGTVSRDSMRYGSGISHLSIRFEAMLPDLIRSKSSSNAETFRFPACAPVLLTRVFADFVSFIASWALLELAAGWWRKR
jgi:hypothetical protein